MGARYLVRRHSRNSIMLWDALSIRELKGMGVYEQA